MPHNRYYINTHLTPSCLIEISGEEGHHLVRVMRAKSQENIEVINGQGQLALCTLTHVDKTHAIARVDSVSCSSPSPPLIAALALTRQLEWAVEKGTELGASSFFLFPGELSEKKSLSSHQQQRLQAIVIAATKQSGRLFLPPILYKPAIEKWDLNADCSCLTTLICHPSKEALFLNKQEQTPTIFFVGPEGGFSPQELNKLKEIPGAQEVRLHSNILRAETAPLVALSLLSQKGF